MIRIFAALALASLTCSTVAQAAKKARRPSVAEMPWLDDKDGVRLEIIEKLIKQKITSQALSIIRDLRSEGMNKPVLDLYQGQALQYQGLDSEAERLLVSARKRMPGDPRPPAALCILYSDFKLYDQAISACKRATNLDKKDAVSWNNYGYLLLFTTDRIEDAEEALRNAVNLDSTQTRYRNNLGHAQVATGDPERAFRTFMSTATRADAAYNVATALERFGHSGDALVYYEQALDHQPNHTMAHDAIVRLETSPEDN